MKEYFYAVVTMILEIIRKLFTRVRVGLYVRAKITEK